MTLLRSSFLNGIAVGIKLLTALVLNKVLAVIVGPGGYAVIGQFNSVVGMVVAVATGGLTNGLTKYTAERRGAPEEQARLWSTAVRLTFVASAATGVVLLVLSPWLAEKVLGSVELKPAIYWLAGSLVLFAANTMLLALLSGMKEFRRYVVANILGSLVGFAVTIYLTLHYGLLGALVSASISQSVALFCTVFVCRRIGGFQYRNLFGKYDRVDARKLAGFSLMALTSMACVPLTQTLVRGHLAGTFGWEATGAWQGVWKISEMSLMVVTATLSVYYLPRLSELRDNAEMRREILSAYRIVLSFTVLAAVLCYVFRDALIGILFSQKFSAMRDLFAWQVTGDVMRIGSWLVAFVLQARAMTKLFIVSELGYGILFYGLVRLLTPHFGVEGATIAYALSYGIYWMWIVIALRSLLFQNQVLRDA